MDLRQITSGRSAICAAVLDDLPEWFGLAEAKAAYIAASDSLPMIACFEDNQAIGFMSLKIHTSYAGELYVLGVKKKWHGSGTGRAMLAAMEDLARQQGLTFLTVKTLSASSADRHYAVTRLFYERSGFMPVEEFPTLWSPENPCLLMIKSL